jgi:glycerol uptake facilitator-like aquaporin
MAYFKGTMVVCLYEFIGTFGLTAAMNATGANVYAVPLALFLLYKISYPFTGSHFNPAVTIGVYISQFSKAVWLHNTIQMMVMIVSQIVGAIIGMEIWRALLEEYANGASIGSSLPYLAPTTDKIW